MSSYSLVIISYNGKDFLRETLRAVRQSLVAPKEIIVVDDFSSDGTSEMVREEMPNVVVLRNEKNLGPTAARNRGAEKATGDYIVFLDNDIEVHPDTFAKLVSFLDVHKDASLVTARLLSEDGSQRRWNVGCDPNNAKGALGGILAPFVGRFPNRKFIKNLYERCDLNLWDHATARKVDWVVEECFAIRRDLFKKISGFDEQFFMFFEGPDLCRRVRATGAGAWFTPDAIATVHEGHAHSSVRRAKLFVQSKYRYYKKHYFYFKSNPVFFWIVEGSRFFFRIRSVN